jgi:hypothetical protein
MTTDINSRPSATPRNFVDLLTTFPTLDRTRRFVAAD